MKQKQLNYLMKQSQRYLLLMAVFFCLLDPDKVQAYYSKPIFLFQNDPGGCNSIATHWVHNEKSSLTEEHTHIVAGLTWSKSEVVGANMAGTSGACFPGWNGYTSSSYAYGIPFIVWGNSDFTTYGKRFFTSRLYTTNPGVWDAAAVKTGFMAILGLAIPEQTTIGNKANSRDIDYVTAVLITTSHTFILVLKAMYDGTARSHYAVYRTYYFSPAFPNYMVTFQ